MQTSTLFSSLLPRLAVLVGLGVATGHAAQAQTAPTWASVRRLTPSNPGYSIGQSIAVAADGSQYVTGYYTGTITLGSISLVAGAGQGHIYLVKYSAAGVALWATKLDTETQTFVAKVAIDATGNAYLAGSFANSITLGTTTLTSTVTQGTAFDGFLVKYDAQGVQQWVKQAVAGRAGNTGSANVYGVATDASGNVVIAGDFLNSVSFGGTPFTGAGVFLYRFSPTGTPLLSKQVSDDGFADDLALDAAGNAYITGGIYAGTSFGTVMPANAGDADVFLCKVNPAGVLQWVQSAGGTNADAGNAVAIDAAGNAVVGGYYSSNDKYIVGFTAQGAVAWTRQIPSSVPNVYMPIEAVAYDGRGGFFVTGRIQGTTIFGATTLTTPSSSLVVARYNSQGTAVWADQAITTTASDFAASNGLAADASGNIYLTGYAGGNAQFGSLPLTTGRTGEIVAKLTAGGIITATRPAALGLALEAYPNPATGATTLVLPAGGGRLALLDALGRTVREQVLPVAAGACPVALTGLAPGLYQLRATLGNGQMAHAALTVQ